MNQVSGLFSQYYDPNMEPDSFSFLPLLLNSESCGVLHTAFGVLQNQAAKYPCRYHDGEYVAILEYEKSLGTGLELY